MRVNTVVAAQVGEAYARHKQVAQARIVAKAILFTLVLERDHALPATGQLAVPFRPHGQQLAQRVCTGDLFVLIAASETQLVGQWWVKGHVVPQPHVLSGG
ncbi:hypothetical protein D3C81_1779940 [compost metagenome]